MVNNAYRNKVVVITGGSSGIGLALAKEFAKQSANIILIARAKEKLEAAKVIVEKVSAKDSSVSIASADVSRHEEITNAINEIGIKFRKIDLLINCAGIATHGRFNDQSTEDIENCMEVNYLGAVYASKAAWQYLKAARGQLSFVSSIAGYVGLIGYSSYAPTKFAITGLAECLYFEGKDDGIRVSIIYPPDTDTPMLEYERKHTLPECIALSKNIKVRPAHDVARVYIKGLQKNKFQIYCDTESRLLRWFKNNFTGGFQYATNVVIRKSRRQ